MVLLCRGLSVERQQLGYIQFAISDIVDVLFDVLAFGPIGAYCTEYQARVVPAQLQCVANGNERFGMSCPIFHS